MLQWEKETEKIFLKGAKNSLIIVNKTAFIVGIENKSVIIILDQNSIKGKVLIMLVQF